MPRKTETIVERYQRAWIQQENLKKEDGRLRYVETSNAAFRRCALEQIGLFDGAVGHDDVDMGLRLTAAGFNMRYVTGAIIHHRNPKNIAELYRDRVKYGSYMVRLANKYPEKFGLLHTPKALRRLTLQTIRRIIADLIYKLPVALFAGDDSYGTRFWPFLDVVLAFGNYVGVYREAQSMLKDQNSCKNKTI